MAWIAITESDVKTRLAGAELSALQTAALASGQSDPLPELIAQVVDEVRGYIAAGGFTLGEGTVVPQKLKSATLAIIRYRVATRLPAKSFLNEDRVREYQDAIRLLEQVARGQFVVEEPTTPEDEPQGGGGSPGITERELAYTREDQDGL
jgi:phage gp36-like protein